MKRRDFVSLGGLAGASLVAAGMAQGSTLSSRYITVGVGGDYAIIADALAAVSGVASASSPLVLKLLPGKHDLSGGEIQVPSWVAIEGCGQEISTIVLQQNSTYLSVRSNSKISNLSIAAQRTSFSAAKGMIVAKRERVVDFYLDRVTFLLTGGYQAAVEQRWYNHVWYWSDVNIYTDSIGINMRGFQYLRNINIFLSGNATGTPYYGIYAPAMCRLYCWNLKCGTGYGETNNPGFGAKLEITNDPNVDVIGIYVPASNPNNPRLELHDLESYCRNEKVNSTNYILNCVRMEAGIARMFGCLTQAEAPSNEDVARDLFTAPEGTIELYAGRYTKVDGNLSSRNQQAVTFKTPSNDNEILSIGADGQHAGSVVMCDASTGPFTLVIPGDWQGGQPAGMQWTFVKTDATVNAVTISVQGSGTISGQSQIVLANPYQKLQIIHGAVNSSEWFEI